MFIYSLEEERSLTNLPHTERIAPLPYTLPRHSYATVCSQYLILLRLFLAQYRTMWFFYVFFGFVWPVGFLFFLKMSSTYFRRHPMMGRYGG